MYDAVSWELLMRCETSVCLTSFVLASLGTNNSIFYGVQGGSEKMPSLVEMRTEINWQYIRVLWIGVRKPLCAQTLFSCITMDNLCMILRCLRNNPFSFVHKQIAPCVDSGSPDSACTEDRPESHLEYED